MSDAVVLNSYQDVQAYLDSLVTKYGTSISGAPHGAFWDVLTYDQFVNGPIPGVPPPPVGQVKILESGSSKTSNIILALRGQGPLFGPTGPIGQMPADGSGPYSAADIQPLANWIDASCPNG